MKIVYAVKWIEIEFGQRDEGYVLYLDKDDCIRDTKKSSENGLYVDGGYFGPIRPLYFIRVPMDSLDKRLKQYLCKGTTWRMRTETNWKPEFFSEKEYIDV